MAERTEVPFGVKIIGCRKNIALVEGPDPQRRRGGVDESRNFCRPTYSQLRLHVLELFVGSLCLSIVYSQRVSDAIASFVFRPIATCQCYFLVNDQLQHATAFITIKVALLMQTHRILHGLCRWFSY